LDCPKAQRWLELDETVRLDSAALAADELFAAYLLSGYFCLSNLKEVTYSL
jgi:hypothetical protein